MTQPEKNGNVELTEAQLRFLEFCKEYGWGMIEVTVKNGQPVMISPIKQNIKLD